MTTAHADTFLAGPPADLIGDDARPLEGDAIRSHNPARPDETIWMASPALKHVREAVAAAREALPVWARAPAEKRVEVLRAYQERLEARADDIARLISLETGKALWDAKQEAGILAGKIDITLDTSSNSGMARVTGFETPVSDTRNGVCSFRPHGVMAVLGPFNFPAHLPNGHIAPALATGNTIVFKPSDKTTSCPWKGTASYYTIEVDGQTNPDAAWVYRDPKSGASNIKDHVAFWRGVTVEK